MRVVSIVGARPQFIKVAPISWQAQNFCEHLVVHTGQHYDSALSENFFSELEIPEPLINLYSGSGSHGAQTALILKGVEEVLLKLKPEWVLVYGDTNSTIGAALAAAKLGVNIGHIEAGLRSFNRLMPEEINRIATDHISSLLFAPTKEALRNLEVEGLSNRSLIVGDVMLETLLHMKRKILKTGFTKNMQIFATIHRAENTDSRERLTSIIDRLSHSPVPINLHAHPRLIRKAEEFDVSLEKGSIQVLQPLSYFETIKGVMQSVGVITDSGGLQKEAFLLETPCLTVRKETEWVETLKDRWNQLDPALEQVSHTWWEEYRPHVNQELYGDGSASQKIFGALINHSS